MTLAQATSATAVVAVDGAPSDFFGYSVAISGDVALVGAKLDDDQGANSGSAYVFSFNGVTWLQEQKLFALDELAYDGFGTSVAIDGDTAVVGAPNRDDRGADSGAAYVFHFNGVSWIQEQKLLAADGASPDLFGSSVSVSGNVIIVGAYQETNEKGFKAGSAYVFRWNGSSWVQEQKLLASDGAGTDYFGYSVSASGDVLVIGAYGDDDKGSSSGSAYVFRRSGSTWAQEQKLLAADGADNDVFGCSVATSGGLAVVGAYWNHDNGIWAGSAYVYRFDGTTWVQEAELNALDGATNDYFGATVAVSGDMVVAGAYQDDDKGGQSGSAYVFRFNGATWIQEAKLIDPNGASNDRFGYAVAASGDRAVVGAYWDDNINGADAGSIYVFQSGCVTNADCDDANPCTTDACGGSGVCQHTNVAAGTVCTDDGSPCTNDLCSNGSCTHPNKADGTACGNAATTDCDNPDTCSNGTCAPNYDVSGTQCTDDGNLCTNDTCNGAGSCTHPLKANGSSCSDGNACTTGDACTTGVCVGGAATNCNDNNACTTDACLPAVGCTHANVLNGTACGNTASTDCDNPDTCNNGACVPNHDASGTLCTDDGNACTNDACNGAGSCMHSNRANGTACGSSATTDCDNPDTCNNGACVPNYDPSGTLCTDDGNACTNDNCNGAGNCAHSNKANGTACGNSAATDCDNPDTCNNGVCIANYDAGGTPCTDDGNPGTSDTCNGSGTCEHVLTTCPDDGNPCTNDVLSSGVCTHPNKANGTACGSSATTDCDNPDSCNNGTCAANHDASGTLCTDDGNACTNDVCNGAGGCTHSNKADGAACGSSVTADCDNPDTCSNGTCVPNYDPSGTPCADDGNSCTNDTCNGAGNCTHPSKANGTWCGDGNVCNGAETCQNGACAPGTMLNCNDNNACTIDACMPANGCTYSNAANGTACGSQITSDCDNPDTCSNGTCVPNYDPGGTPCTDDGNACTADSCSAGVCQHTLITCDDGMTCTSDSCNPATGCSFTWATCGLADACCGPSCTGATDPDCIRFLPSGAACTSNSQCESKSCKGPRGRKVCK